jgi:hypothetical protein
MRQLAAIAIVALWPPAAGVPIVCPDETGAWTPDACDLLEPFDPSQERHTCDFLDLLAGRLDPVCTVYWRKEAETDPGLRALLTRISQCAQTARLTSGGRFHPESCRLGLVAGKRPGWVTGRVEALRQRPPLGG